MNHLIIPNLDKDPTAQSFFKQAALKQLGFYRGPLDNWWGDGSETALKQWEEALANPPAPLPPLPGGFPQEAVDFILEEEGLDQPGRWPKGGSGITLGYGCDIGADPDSLRFWNGILTDEQISRLATAKGITGQRAGQIAHRFDDIHVSREDALKVFMQQSLPREIALTRRTFTGIDTLPPQVLGALTSLVYNRGADLDRDESDGDHRLEMRRIADLIARYAADGGGEPSPGSTGRLNSTLDAIADNFEAMKRLWVNKPDSRGLLARRDREAALVRSAMA